MRFFYTFFFLLDGFVFTKFTVSASVSQLTLKFHVLTHSKLEDYAVEPPVEFEFNSGSGL